MKFVTMKIGSRAIMDDTDVGHINIIIGSVSSFMRKGAQISPEETIRDTVFK